MSHHSNRGADVRPTRGRWPSGVAALALVAASLVAFAPSAGAANVDNVNHPAYWEAQGWGTCVKYDPVSTPFVLGAPATGTYWSLLVLKAGSEASNSDWLTDIPNPAPGTYYHPSGKTISHVIVCRRPGSPPATTTTSTPGGGCGTYMPTNVAVSPTHGQPGDTLTITGSGAPNDILTIAIGSTTFGTATVGPTGSFSFSFVIPDSYTGGNYTITVTSSQCPTPRSVTIVVDPLDLSGCGPNGDRLFQPGELVSWKLMGAPFDTTKPVSLSLSPRGPGSGSTATLYSGSYGSGTVTFTVPSSLTQEKYFIDQIGQQKNKKTMTKSCPVRIGINYVLAGSEGSSAADVVAPASKAALVLAAGGLLLLLRFRAPRRRRRL